MTWASIALGGALGALARYSCTMLTQKAWPGSFPWGTLLANGLGAIGMGLAAALFEHKLQSPELKAFVMVGFLGALTTFSTFSLEGFQFLRQGQWNLALGHALVHNLLCLCLLGASYSAFSQWAKT